MQEVLGTFSASLQKATESASASACSSESWRRSAVDEAVSRLNAQEPQQSAGQKRAFGAWTAGAKPVSTKLSGKSVEFSSELTGLVAMANQASRLGCGSLIWYAYNLSHSKGRKRQPGIGSLLVGVTIEGAKKMLAEMEKREAEHWDAFLWRMGTSSMHEESCYVYPPVGNYQTHFSGTIDEERANEFAEKPFIGQSVIPAAGDWKRQLCKMVDQKGVFEVLLDEVVFNDDRSAWRTMQPPASPYDPSSTWQSVLRAVGWVSQTGNWIGPPCLSGKGSSGGKSDQYDLIRNTPEAFINMAGEASPISLLASELVTDVAGEAWSFPEARSKRYWQARRRDIFNYKLRMFTEDPNRAKLLKNGDHHLCNHFYHQPWNLDSSCEIAVTPKNLGLRPGLCAFHCIPKQILVECEEAVCLGMVATVRKSSEIHAGVQMTHSFEEFKIQLEDFGDLREEILHGTGGQTYILRPTWVGMCHSTMAHLQRA